MMATSYQLNEVSKIIGRGVFVDANVWIYLFWATGRHNYEKAYASVFKKLLKQDNRLSVDFLVISEIVNRAMRLEHQKYLKSHGYTEKDQSYKDYRDTEDGRETLRDIYITVKEDILNRCTVIGKSFGIHDITDFLVVDELDFVDKAIVALCKENDLVLLTNDRDFKHSGLDILTGNPHILTP